jgi:hypothetical protein
VLRPIQFEAIGYLDDGPPALVLLSMNAMVGPGVSPAELWPSVVGATSILLLINRSSRLVVLLSTRHAGQVHRLDSAPERGVSQ